MTEHTLTWDHLQLLPSDLYTEMGYGDATPDDDVRKEVDHLLGRAAQLARPLFAYLPMDGTLLPEEEQLILHNTPLHIGRIITRQLRGSSRFALFVATAGAEYESFQHELMTAGDMVAVYMADILGSVIAEKTADCMEAHLQAFLEQQADTANWHHTNRYSPGYCGWHVSEQQSLFSLFPAPHPCGISLTDSSLMLPIKSVSGVIGLGPQVRHLDYTCGLCSYDKCFRRKKKPGVSLV
jgi:hypothetical protein